MSVTFAPEVAGNDSIPSVNANGGLQGGTVRRFRATIPYAGQASGATIVLADVPAGHQFAYGIITASATAGASATIAIGVAGATGRYRTGAVFTAVDTPTLFGNAAAKNVAPLTAGERVIATIGVAALPSSANFMVVDLFYTAP